MPPAEIIHLTGPSCAGVSSILDQLRVTFADPAWAHLRVAIFDHARTRREIFLAKKGLYTTLFTQLDQAAYEKDVDLIITQRIFCETLTADILIIDGPPIPRLMIAAESLSTAIYRMVIKLDAEALYKRRLTRDIDIISMRHRELIQLVNLTAPNVTSITLSNDYQLTSPAIAESYASFVRATTAFYEATVAAGYVEITQSAATGHIIELVRMITKKTESEPKST